MQGFGVGIWSVYAKWHSTLPTPILPHALSMLYNQGLNKKKWKAREEFLALDVFSISVREMPM